MSILLPDVEVLMMASLVIFIAAYVQTILGIGFGLTASPLLALIDPQLVPVSALFLSGITAMIGGWNERTKINWTQVSIGVCGRIAGCIIAVVMLALIVGKSNFELIFGVFIAFAIILSIGGWQLKFNRINLLLMSTLSGLMATITSVGAPPMAMIYQAQNPVQARPTLASFFAFGCLISLVGLMVSNWASDQAFILAFLLAPAMFAGIFVARKFPYKMMVHRYRIYLLSIAGIASIILIYNGLRTL
ncbi:MAG: sulfite exporter TauE/SafE family protein [Pseudomonadota bacterium]